MAHNKLYRNFIILQEDEKTQNSSKEKALSGYAKIEAKNDKCKISFYAQNLLVGEKYSIVLICYKKDVKQIVDLGSLVVKDSGKAEVSKEYYINNIAGMNLSYEKISGAAVCKHKDGKINYLIYGFMNGEHIKDDWKKCNIVKSSEDEDIMSQPKKMEIKKEDKCDEASEKPKEKHEKKDMKDKENTKEYKKDNQKEKSKEKSKDKYEEDKCDYKSDDCNDKKDDHHDEKDQHHDEKDHYHDKEDDYGKKDYHNYKEDNYKKEHNYDNKNYCYDKKKEDECPVCSAYKQKHDYSMKEEDKDCDYNCEYTSKDRENVNVDFDEYESRIEQEKEMDAFDFELRGELGDFFKGVSKGFEEVKNKFKEIKYCKWYKIKINTIDDMCNSSNYNKYTIAFYPMINYYPYIKRYGYYMLGYKCDKKGEMKYLVYGIPGKKDKDDQPFMGKTGFVTWMSLDNTDMGYWLMFYDYKKSTVVVPMSN